MANFGVDSARAMEVEDLIQTTKIVGLDARRNAVRGAQAARLAYALRSYDIPSKSGTTDLFVYHPSSCSTVQMTRSPKGTGLSDPKLMIDLHPGVAQDTLCYVKGGQLWQIPLAGGEAWQVTHFGLPIVCYKVFANVFNQIWLSVVLDVYASMTVQQTIDFDAAEKDSGSSGIVFDKLMVRHWDNWGTYKKRHHIFVCQLEVNSDGLLVSPSHHELRDIMFGMETDCPGKAPGHGEEDFDVSSDGFKIAFSARRVATAVDSSQPSDMAWTTDTPIYMIDVLKSSATGAKAPKIVSGTDWTGVNNSPKFSPDAKYLAFLSMERAVYESDRLQLRLYDLAANTVVQATRTVDLSFGGIEWAEDDTIYTTAQYRGANRIFRLKLALPVPETLANVTADDPPTCVDASGTCVASLQVMIGDEGRTSPMLSSYLTPSGQTQKCLFYLQSTLFKPNEIMVATIGDHDDKLFIPFVDSPVIEGEMPLCYTDYPRHIRLVSQPCPQFSNGDIAEITITQHYFEGGDGELVHAWYLPPVDLSEADVAAGKKYPLVLVVHGGPQGAIVNGWNYRWNMAMFAAKGYGVVAVNFHGSSGFGQKFMDSIRGDWGGKPFEDCMKGVDYVLSRYNYLNSERVGALGASYGGYVMNWINGHTQRFKCLVNHDGIFSLRSLYFTTEELWFPEWEFGLPWEAEDMYARWSPDSFVGTWQTPTLVIQGGIDFRVVETEAIATFTALQRRGVASKMLFFPDENHWVLKPLNSLKWHRTVFDWLQSHLK